ncbi:MAG: ABC transporter ATP-binding protein [Actinomycetota bacterium]
MPEPLLSVRNLKTHFFTDDGVVKAVDDISFDVGPSESLGIVGESGSGKSVTAYSILRLVAKPGRIVNGQILFQGRDLVKATEAEMRHIRGNDISIIFQEPMTSLDPLYTVGNQLLEAIQLHQGLKGHAARQAAIEALDAVGIPDPAQRIDSYPHQMSGGMRQRAMIAIALSCNPELLIADEPTTALDVTIQAKILDLLKHLRVTRKMALLLITHNLGLVAEMCDRLVVMHGGLIVEAAGVHELFKNPAHPYTRGLLRSIPTLQSPPKHRLPTLEWDPTPEQRLRSNLVEVSPGHFVSEWVAGLKDEGGRMKGAPAT